MARAFLRPPFWIAIATMAVLSIAGIAEEYLMSSDPSAAYFFSSFANEYVMVNLALVVLPFGLAYCADWNHQFIRSSCMRSGIGAYTASKAVVTALSAFLAVFVSSMLVAGLLLTQMPMFSARAIAECIDAGYNVYDPSAIGYLAMATPALYFALKSATVGLACMAWALFALAVSSVRPNPLVALAAPIIAYYLILYFVPVVSPFLQPSVIIDGNFPVESAAESIVASLVINLSVGVLLGLFFWRRVRWNLANG